MENNKLGISSRDIIETAVANGIRVWGKKEAMTLYIANVWLEGYMEGLGLDDLMRENLRIKMNDYRFDE